MDRVLEMLQDAGFVDESARGGWVLSRDLEATTLHDLGQAMRLGIRGSDLEATGKAGWEGHLKTRLGEMHAAEKSAANVSLRSILLANDDAGDEAAPDLRSVS